jgi:poly(A) polymerase
MTKKRMKEMRFSNDMIDDVSTLVELHLRFHGYGTGEWTDSAVRRYVRDAGPLLTRLHKLTRADSTTRNKRRAADLQRAYDSLERRIEVLAAEEELAAIRPDLDGAAIMRILEIPPGRVVGEAYEFLLNLRRVVRAGRLLVASLPHPLQRHRHRGHAEDHQPHENDAQALNWEHEMPVIGLQLR